MRTQPMRSTEAGYNVVVERSIQRIEPSSWDEVNAPYGLYWTHRFFTCVESSSAPDTNHWYFMLYRGDELVATAVLSRFVVSLDLLLPVWVQRLCNIVRRVYPSFFRLCVLFCGIPVSIGKHTVALSGKVSPEFVLDNLNGTMIRIAREQGIRYLCFKEFTEKDMPTVQVLERLGYFRAYSVPRLELELRWQSFDMYLRSMRHGYRRMVQRSLAQLGITNHERSIWAEGDDDDQTPRLVVRQFTPEMAGLTHQLYLEVMRRTGVKLEILNRGFFERLAEEMAGDLVSICLEDEEGIQGTALLGHNGPCLNFLFVGFNYQCRDRYQTYFNLLNGIISYGIERGFERIDLGQTTYEIKQRLGGEGEPVYFYLRALSPVVHKSLRLLKGALFPSTPLMERRVFRQSAR